MNTSVSEERLAANRANAQRSTGPKTREGRAASRMNALKHGLLSQEVLICSPHRYESEEELFALHDRFRDELQPMGPLELMLCDQIVTTHWRLRRVLAAESAEMALSLRRGRSQFNQQAESRSVQVGSKTYELAPPWEETAEGCQKAQRSLREIASAVQREGGVTEGILGDKSISFLTVVQDLRAMLNRRMANPNGVEEKAWAEQHLTEVMDYLDHKIREMALLEETHYAAALMPEVEVLEKFGRYETMLNRQLNRAMTQLTKLQKDRRKQENAALSSGSDLLGLPKVPGVPRSPRSKSISDPLEQAREILRNKASAPSAVQSSKSKVQSSEELPNEPTAQSAVQSSEFKVPGSEELRNEPISLNKSAASMSPAEIKAYIERCRAAVKDEGIPPFGATEIVDPQLGY
jgi:hypothetical protein